MIEFIAGLVRPWENLYSGSTPVQAAVVFLHLAARVVVIVGLAIMVGTGVLMLLADVKALLPSWVFWVKMACFGLLLWNGVRLRRIAASQVPGEASAGWRPLR